jgi:hypothetical protein
VTGYRPYVFWTTSSNAARDATAGSAVAAASFVCVGLAKRGAASAAAAAML